VEFKPMKRAHSSSERGAVCLSPSTSSTATPEHRQ
jgi:hypothetical protein